MKLYPEEQLVMLSALQHYSYCPRQCALIHLEQTYDENIYTIRGMKEHKRVHEASTERRGSLRIERGLPLFCDSLGIYGVADAVEFHLDADDVIESIQPIEYKHGKRHKAEHDDIQLCAQALCLESMFQLSIPVGAIYHISSKKRRDVILNHALRKKVKRVIEKTRELLWSHEMIGRTLVLPSPLADTKKCCRCSLFDSCLPLAKDKLA